MSNLLVALLDSGVRADRESMARAAPVIAAQALLAHGMHDDVVIAYVQRTWQLDRLDANAAVAAAHTIAGDRHGIATAPPRDASRS